MMDIPMMDSYLESLDGYIRDDDKLVTYKWLSKELEVHVNVAKTILSLYWEKYKNNELVATFMLIGNLKNDGMRVEVVKDVDLNKAKEKFDKIISEHIYSLQKTLTNIELLALTGKGDSRFSAIKCEKSVILSDEELLKMRWGKATIPQVALTEKTGQNISSKKTEPNITSKKTEQNIFSKKTEQTVSSKKSEQNVSTKKDTGTARESPKSMDESKKETEPKSEEKPAKKISPPTKSKGNERKGAISKKPVQTTKVGFGNLFGKAANQQKAQASSSARDSSVESARKQLDDSLETKSSKARVDTSVEKVKEKEYEKSSNVTRNEPTISSPEKEISSKSGIVTKKHEKSNSKKSKGKKGQKNSRGTKRERSQDSGDETKKRKRIFVASDSSEESAPPSDTEDMFDSPPRREPSPIKNKSPSPPTFQQIGNKRKVRKLVDKTFLDDDGFLMTKKVHVYESCSEEESEVMEVEKKAAPVVTEKKKKIESERPKEKENVKKKQTTLMNFFKKA